MAQCDEPRYSGVDHIRSTGRSGIAAPIANRSGNGGDGGPFRKVTYPYHLDIERRLHGGDIKATKCGKTERQESGCGSQAQTDAETVAEKDADCTWKASGEIEKGEVSAGTQQIRRYR